MFVPWISQKRAQRIKNSQKYNSISNFKSTRIFWKMSLGSVTREHSVLIYPLTRMSWAYYSFLSCTLLHQNSSMKHIWIHLNDHIFDVVSYMNLSLFCAKRTIKFIRAILFEVKWTYVLFFARFLTFFQVYGNEYKYGTNFKCKLVWIASQERKNGYVKLNENNYLYCIQHIQLPHITNV